MGIRTPGGKLNRAVHIVDAVGDIIGGASLVTEAYDYIGLAYTGDDLTTLTYKSGGSGGSTVATLTLGYTGDQLTSITKA